MKIGIVADSHDNIENIKKARDIFKERKVDFVIHAGDYVNPNALRSFDGIKLIGIFGNNDGEKIGLQKAFNDIRGQLKGDFYGFEEDNLKFAVYHGTVPELKDALIDCGKYDVVIYGHTHIIENKTVGNTLVINPGTCHGFDGKATIVIFDTKTKKAEFVELG